MKFREAFALGKKVNQALPPSDNEPNDQEMLIAAEKLEMSLTDAWRTWNAWYWGIWDCPEKTSEEMREKQETFDKDQVTQTIEDWLDFGETSEGAAHMGYYSGAGFAARCLRWHLIQVQAGKDWKAAFEKLEAKYRDEREGFAQETRDTQGIEEYREETETIILECKGEK
jgi:hypothetical protein